MVSKICSLTILQRNQVAMRDRVGRHITSCSAGSAYFRSVPFFHHSLRFAIFQAGIATRSLRLMQGSEEKELKNATRIEPKHAP